MSEPRKAMVVRPAARVRPVAARAIRRAPLPHEVDVPDPLADLPEGGRVEQSAAAEVGAIERGFRARAAAEAARFDAVTGTGYYAVLVFENCDQCSAFLAAVGQDPDAAYVDGREVADRLGIDLPASVAPKPKIGRVDPTYAAMAAPPKGR